MASMMQPSIILLREGTDRSQGRAQIVSNINACEAIADTIRTTLGPRGMDKLIYGARSQTISNDGATIMRLLDIVHPAAKALVDIARSQDEEVGDGTTSVVVLAAELLREAKRFVEEGIHPRIIVRGLRTACDLAVARVGELARDVVAPPPPQATGPDAAPESEAVQAQRREFREMLERCSATAMNSKLIASHKEFFSRMVVDAVLCLDQDTLPVNMIGVKKEPGGAMEDSLFVDGVAFKKTFSYAGFEQQPKDFKNPRVLCLNVELELKAEKDNAEVRIEDPAKYQSIVDAEWRVIYQKLERCVASGAKIILSRLAIGDLATQYFADRGLFCAGRVTNDDLDRVCAATGAVVQSTTADIDERSLGSCAEFHERQVGKERYNFFTGCPRTRSATIVLRGGGEHFIDEAARSLHDAIMICRRTVQSRSVVAGGGATEIELSGFLREHSRTIAGKQQMIVGAFAKALECIPRQIAENAGFDPCDILNKLRKKHTQPSGRWFGIDIDNEGAICDCMETFVHEPTIIKRNSLQAATEAACLILSIDETVKSQAHQQEVSQAQQAYANAR